MEKQDTTTVIYHNIPIEEYECVKEFRSQIEHIAIKLNKSDAWICKTKRAINNGLKIMFLHYLQYILNIQPKDPLFLL